MDFEFDIFEKGRENMSSEKQAREYWGNRIYEEIIEGSENLYHSLNFNFKEVYIEDGVLKVDVSLSVGYKEELNEDNVEKTLQQIRKTLDLLSK